ncbi:MAG: alpha/beta hydrolase family protein [Actinomycetota bacterium]|nr:alpha/beta hydrolase [Actinomycetota bacterium]
MAGEGTAPAARNIVWRAGRMIVRTPGAGIVLAPPRTAAFAVNAWVRARGKAAEAELPAPKLSAALAAQVALDEMMLGAMKSPRRYPTEADYRRIAAELLAARELYGRNGWLENPSLYHRAPPPISPTVRAGWAYGMRFERMSWRSGFEPYADEPGRDRWMSYEKNHTMHAWTIRTRPDRPWLICVHGFGVGVPTADFYAFRAKRLAQELGVNLLFPVLPLHGPRRTGRIGGAEMMTHHLQQFVLGMAQAMWDVRSAIGWIREQGGSRVGVYGMSLGAYVAALLATLEPELSAVIAGVPICDLPRLFHDHSPVSVRRRAEQFRLFDPEMLSGLGVISPLAAPSIVPAERLYVYGGLGDRLATPEQSHALWTHWGKPSNLWYHGSHVAFLWNADVARFIDGALMESLIGGEPEPVRFAKTS